MEQWFMDDIFHEYPHEAALTVQGILFACFVLNIGFMVAVVNAVSQTWESDSRVDVILRFLTIGGLIMGVQRTFLWVLIFAKIQAARMQPTPGQMVNKLMQLKDHALMSYNKYAGTVSLVMLGLSTLLSVLFSRSPACILPARLWYWCLMKIAAAFVVSFSGVLIFLHLAGSDMARGIASLDAINKYTIIKEYKPELFQHVAPDCLICFGEYAVGDVVRQLCCPHIFHKDCIDDWLHRKNQCPVCMTIVGEPSCVPPRLPVERDEAGLQPSPQDRPEPEVVAHQNESEQRGEELMM